jgi:glycine dehydrogenase subunit 1
MPFVPHTEEDVQEMLRTIGVQSIDELFDEIPAKLRCGELTGIDVGLPEMEIGRIMNRRAKDDGSPLCFIGAGAYAHHIPGAVWQLATRGEFYSAYTPYQAEASQGTLQVLYEFQSMMTELTAMEVSNASLYDGASALAEAVLMAVRANRQSKTKRVLMPRAVHPHYRKVVRNIVANQGIELIEIDFSLEDGHSPVEALAGFEGQDIAALVVAQPNFFGVLEEVDQLTDWAHAQGALVIGVVNPVALAVLAPPGEWGATGADIAVGEGQPLGVPMSSGGPYFGFMCTRKALVRQMPGRIVARTVDLDGKTGYTLTLQAREQHIRRSKATSNICTNQGLMVTAATIHMALLGPEGLRRMASACHANTGRLLERLTANAGVRRRFQRPFFHEAVIELEQVAVPDLLRTLAAHNVLGGYPLSDDYPELGNCLLVCATEVHDEEDFEAYDSRLARVIEMRTQGQGPVKPKI